MKYDETTGTFYTSQPYQLATVDPANYSYTSDSVTVSDLQFDWSGWQTTETCYVMKPNRLTLDDIVDVIYNPPATIVYWKDKTKTVVKVKDGEPYDTEKGFLYAVVKKVFGNDLTFHQALKKWCNDEEIAAEFDRRAKKAYKKALKAASQ